MHKSWTLPLPGHLPPGHLPSGHCPGVIAPLGTHAWAYAKTINIVSGAKINRGQVESSLIDLFYFSNYIKNI